MEIGAVVGAAPRTECPPRVPRCRAMPLSCSAAERDATAAAAQRARSKSHNICSHLESMRRGGSKGQCARRTQTAEAVPQPGSFNMLIKRCNDFRCGRRFRCHRRACGRHWISSLTGFPKNMTGLDGTELAISESQERMAVVVAAADCETFHCTCKRQKTLKQPLLPA